MKLKNKYVIEQSRYPEEKKTHVLWYESKTLHGCGYRAVFKGTYLECLEEKEKRCENVRKSKSYSFRLLRKALHNK